MSYFIYIYTSEKTGTSFRYFYCASIWKSWMVFFFYEILTLVKSKYICLLFQVITNQTNHNYLFQWNQKHHCWYSSEEASIRSLPFKQFFFSTSIAPSVLNSLQIKLIIGHYCTQKNKLYGTQIKSFFRMLTGNGDQRATKMFRRWRLYNVLT